MPVCEQLARLADAGVPDLAGIGRDEFAAHARGLPEEPGAIWISGGTGHDVPQQRNAPEVGWCWAGNRRTRLGFASARRRVA